MSVRRSPPQEDLLKTPPVLVHYGSDSAINASTIGAHSDTSLNITKRQKRSFQDFSEHSFSIAAEIKSLFNELKTEQDEKFDTLTSAVQVVITQNEVIQKSVDVIASQHEDLLIRMNTLEKENTEYKKLVLTLENKIDLLEKRSHNSTIEIRNIPKQTNENKRVLTDYVKNIGMALSSQTPILDSEIRDIHRSKTDAIVVEFSTTSRKELIISDYKIANKTSREKKRQQLSTNHINIPGTTRPVYISEFLTARARRVFYIARENVKNKKLVATWTSFGKVYVKKTEGAAPVRIDGEEDLQQLLM